MPSKRKRSGPGFNRDAPADAGGYKRTRPAYNQVYRVPSRNISGPGIFVTCVQGKERKAALQFIDMLNELADRLYPGIAPQPVPEPSAASVGNADDEEDMDALRNGAAASSTETKAVESQAPETETPAKEDQADKAGDDDIEAQIAAELRDIKSSERRRGGVGKAVRFRSVETDTECLVFISVSPPFDPYLLTYTLLEEVESTGVARSRFVQRLTPVSTTCPANATALADLARSVLPGFFGTNEGEGKTFKIDPRIRSHSQLKRNDVIQTIAANIPTADPENDGGERRRIHNANLTEPDLWIVVEVVKNAAAISVVRDYSRFKKLNLQSLAQTTEGEAQGRVADNLVQDKAATKAAETKAADKEPQAAAQPAVPAAAETDTPAEEEKSAASDPQDMSAFRLF